MARKRKLPPADGGFLREVALARAGVPSFEEYPFAIPAIRSLQELALHPKVTFFVGENGSGKSTLIEAIAVAAGFNPEGGSKNFSFVTRASESNLHEHLVLSRGFPRERDGFFLRAESFFNVATELERLDEGPGGPPLVGAYGGRSLHEQSHGESFMSLVANRFRGGGLYILDEPEAALSPTRQLLLLAHFHRLVQQGSQLLVATHSPILLGYPDATIWQLGPDGIAAIAYEDTEHYQVTRSFLTGRETFFNRLFAKDEGPAEE